MRSPNKALLLIGSPKRKGSTSFALGNYLISQLESRGLQTHKIHLYKAIKTAEKQKELLKAIDEADIIVFSCPLYVDCLPAGVIHAFELIAQHRTIEHPDQPPVHQPQFLAIINCGFPESDHNELAIEMCRLFSHAARFAWSGGFGIGMGGVIGGHPLSERAKMARNIICGFDLAAEALLTGRPVPSEAITIAKKPLIPKWLYVKMGNFGWNQMAKKNGVRGEIKARPYKN